ncbi:MAG: hypothetical protein IKA51_00680 [Clostridia bacterium]|nr:hypothetical protein [Clostridia bacterium]
MFYQMESSLFDIELINKRITESPREFVIGCEEIFSNEIENTADEIAKSGARLVMLTGPSSSGKTTLSHRLCEELFERGITSAVISLDNFYRSKDEMKQLKITDFESVEAIDTDLLREKLTALCEGKRVYLPTFDFISSKRIENSRELCLSEKSVAIVEGIHALEPKVLEMLPRGSFIKMFITGDSDYTLKGETVLKGSQVRLLRRAVRDSRTRNADAELTLSFWNGVKRGERLYINPLADTADIKLVTAFPFDPAALKRRAMELFSEVKEESENYERARKVLSALKYFKELDGSLIPDYSLTREFIGGSKYK